jgi:hypothetical protein
MTEETRTYPLRLKTDYVSGTIIEFCHFRNISLEATEKAAIYLETVSLVLDLQNMRLGLIPDYDGDESEVEKLAKFNQAENRSERFGLQFLTRKNNTGDWDEDVEIICINRGRKDYIDLLQPFFCKYSVRMLEANDAFAVKLIDYGYGLLKLTDTLKVTMGIRIEVSKKNDTEALEARIATLELALKGRLIDLTPNTLLGRNAGTGIVETIPQNIFAKTTDIDTAIFNLIGGAPGALNTLDELAAALNDDASFAATVTNQLALKAPLVNPTFTGFTTLGGNVGIKLLYLEGFMAATQGSFSSIPHGLNSEKIIWFGVKINTSGTTGIGEGLDNVFGGYAFDSYYDSQYIHIGNVSGNSVNILSKPLSIVIFYRS